MKSALKFLPALLLATTVWGYETFQGPTEVLYWDNTKAVDGYTFFGVGGHSYLVDMQGRQVHTWSVGNNPHLLDDGSVLDATQNPGNSDFTGFKKVSWDGSNVWSYLETRTNYVAHHDFIQIFNPKLGTNTILYIARKSVTYDQCITAGCSTNASYTNNYNRAEIDAIIEVNLAGTIVWEWCFYDHLIQDFDASKSNYVGAGLTISNYPGRLNANIPGMPIQSDWLHCNGIDYNQTLDQIAISSVRGEFYIIDHGGTFVSNNPAASVTLAASSAGDFLYRFGDPGRYNQGAIPSILTNWTESTTGHKQLGGNHHVSWIPAGYPRAGNILIFNNAQNLFEHTQQSYAMEINPYLNSSSNSVGSYVNPPEAGYYSWSPGHNTDKSPRLLSNQLVWEWHSKAVHGMFNHIGGGVQRLINGNTLICSDQEGHLIEVTDAGEVVWEYINPVSISGILKFKRDNWPMDNGLFRAYRYRASDPPLAGRTLTPGATITGRTPSYVSP